jgi:hypothetical protein
MTLDYSSTTFDNILFFFYLDDANSIVSYSTAESSQVSSETSSSREAILARMGHPNSSTGFRKAPVPLPGFVTRERQGSIPSDSSNVVQDDTSSPGIPHGISSHPHFKKPSVPITDSASRDPNESVNPGSSSPISQSATNHSGFKKRPAPLPNPITPNQKENIPTQPSPSPSTLHRVFPPGANTFPDPKTLSMPPPNPMESVQNEYASLSHDGMSHSTNGKKPIDQDEYEIIHPQSLSVSLDAVLPLKCMFFEFEDLINGYQRKDPRAIIYPKMKATMPKITTNEINILQRYSNT